MLAGALIVRNLFYKDAGWSLETRPSRTGINPFEISNQAVDLLFNIVAFQRPP